MKDGYPTNKELARITRAKWEEDPHGMIDFLRSIGFDETYGTIKEDEDADAIYYTLSTGGWSGNETIIETMERTLWWLMYWHEIKRGGHYTFRIPK